MPYLTVGQHWKQLFRAVSARVCHLRHIKADEYRWRLGDVRVKHVNKIAVADPGFVEPGGRGGE